MKINYSFVLLLLSYSFTGKIKELFYFILCFVVHEIGHIFFCLIFNVKVKSFSLSFYGGTLNLDVAKTKNSKLKLSFIYFGGILFNYITYLIVDEELIKSYSLLLLFFNSLPIIPLDGFNIIKLFINKTLVYNINVCFMCLLLVVGIYYNSLGILLIFLILLYKNIVYFKEKDNLYLYNLVKSMV